MNEGCGSGDEEVARSALGKKCNDGQSMLLLFIVAVDLLMLWQQLSLAECDDQDATTSF